jgi:hypothetical protein
MTELPPATQAIMESLIRMAEKVLAAPVADREAIYEIIRQSLAETRHTLNVDDETAADWERNYMTWLRALVSMIERSGGAQGGKA